MLLPPTHRAGRPGRSRARLAIEQLEDRLTPAAGSLDLSFGTNGKVIADFGTGGSVSSAVALQPDGKIVLAVKFEDPGADTWAAVIDYGDGTVEQLPDVRSGVPFQLRHTYSAPGTYHVTVAVIDDDGDIGTTAFDVLVRGA